MTFGATQTVKAYEHLTDAQIEQATKGHSDNEYILTAKGGGFFSNLDGSANFSAEQVAAEGKVMTIAEYKEFLKTVDFSDAGIPEYFARSAWVPSGVHVIPANESYTSNPFYEKGWRYSGSRFVPAAGTGDYLFWQALGDSGLVEDGHGISVTVNPGDYKSVFSVRGTYFKTYNPVPGSKYTVSNPV